MGLEVVTNEILARGSDEEQRILREAESERQKLLDQAEGEADELRARILQETRARVEALRREHQSASEFEVRRRRLTLQRELTDEFRRWVLEALAGQSAKDRERILTVLVKRAQKDLPEGRVHARKDDMAFLTKTGYQPGKELPIAGGFQVESEDGTILLDHRYETILDNVWKDILADTRTLFEG